MKEKIGGRLQVSLIWKYIKRYKLVLLLNVIGSFGFVFVELGLPTMLANLINGTIAGIGQSQIRNIIIWMLAFTFFGFFGRSLVAYATSRLTTNMIAEMRDDLFSKIQTFSHEEFDRLGVSSLVTRVTNDAFILMQFSQMVLRLGVSTILMLFASFYMIFQTSRSLSIVLIPAFPFLLISVLIIGKLSRPLSEAQQKNLDNINLTLRESLTGLLVIRAFVREKFQSARFSVVNEAYSTVSRRLFYLMAWTQPLFSHVINLIIIAIVWMGSDLLETGDLQIGTMVAYIEYSFFALYSFLNFAIVFMMYPRAAVSAGRIQEVFDTVSSIDSNEMGIQGTKTHGFIQFENVSFSYPDNKGTPVIENINFSAGPGQTIAFIGSTGSGKSTIMQLIPRFYDVTGGRIIMDGYDLRDYNLKALRQKIGYIPQKSLLFTGSIADNLRYGKFNATHGEMEEASDISQATDFILDKAEKFEEHLSEGGSNLSGGQKQRLSIARAVVRRPDFYIFDDSFSALDYKTDQQLRNRLKKETLHATVIIVAQRVSSILHADKIIVLNEGRVVGEGTHRELLKTNKIYYDIASSQLREEELA